MEKKRRGMLAYAIRYNASLLLVPGNIKQQEKKKKHAQGKIQRGLSEKMME